MIKFKSIYLEGFGSFIQDTKFKLDRPGLNIIVAENGSGKTTTFSGLYWTLYGKTLKASKTVETWPKYRTSDYKGTKCRIKFIKEGKVYEVIRCKNYKGKVLGAKGGNRLIILEAGKDITNRDKRGTDGIQAQINGIIGYSADLFINSLLFGQRLQRLIQASGPSKKKVFEEAFEANYINNARKKAEEALKIARDNHVEISRKIELLSVTFKASSELSKSIFQKIEILKSEADSNLKLWSGKKSKLIEAIAEIEKNAPKAEEYTNKLNEAKGKLKALLSKSSLKSIEDDEFRTKNQIDRDDYYLGQYRRKLKALRADLMGIKKKCPNCGSKLPPEKIEPIRDKLKKEITHLKGDIKIKAEELKQTKERYLGILDKLASNKKNKDRITSIESTIKSLETKVINTKSDIKYLDQKREELKEAINQVQRIKDGAKAIKVSEDNYLKSKREVSKLKKELKALKQEIKPLTKEVENLSWLVNDALSNKGLKTYIFDTMLKQLNDRLKYYTQFIGRRPEFKIDFTSANKDLYATVYSPEGDLQPYEDLSGGEAQLIDVVTAFGLHDMMVAGRPCNIMILDEVFEGLDENNLDIVFDLIQDKAKDKSLFLITHNASMHNSSTKIIRMHKDAAGQTVLKMLKP